MNKPLRSSSELGYGVRHADAFAVLADECELAVDARHRDRLADSNQGACLVHGHVVDAVAGWVGQVDHARQWNALIHFCHSSLESSGHRNDLDVVICNGPASQPNPSC